MIMTASTGTATTTNSAGSLWPRGPTTRRRSSGATDGKRAIRCATFSSPCTRRSYIFYLHNGVKPLYTIAAFGFLATMEPSDLANRIALGAVLFLSIYAVQWTTAGHIPRLPFKTVWIT